MARRLALIAPLSLLALAAVAAAQDLHPAVVAAAGPGAKAWEKHCHGCHDLPGARGLPPSRVTLSKMTADEVYQALTDGNMKAQGDYMGEDERQAVAMHVTAKPLSFLVEAEAAPRP